MEPTLTTRGIAAITDNPGLIPEALEEVRHVIKEFSRRSDADLQEEIHLTLRRFFKNVSGKKPETIVLVHEI
jgi:mRNA degradation ribonuclease J1/J2